MQRFFADEWDEFIRNCDFTDSELDVIKLLRRGWAEEDIASELYTSRSTIKRRKRSIVNKIKRYLLIHA